MAHRQNIRKSFGGLAQARGQAMLRGMFYYGPGQLFVELNRRLLMLALGNTNPSKPETPSITARQFDDLTTLALDTNSCHPVAFALQRDIRATSRWGSGRMVNGHVRRGLQRRKVGIAFPVRHHF